MSTSLRLYRRARTEHAMMFSQRSHDRLAGILFPVWRLTFLFLPMLLLLAAALRERQAGAESLMLWMGMAFQLGVCVLVLCSRGSWNGPMGPSIVTLYLIAL